MQSAANHTRWVPLYHFVAFPLLIANAVHALWRLSSGVNVSSVLFAGTSVALVLVAFYARVFALRAQDRVIRLEVRLRLFELMPAERRADIMRLSVNQMIGLRFASDAELPDLAMTALRDNLSGSQIKKLIKHWVPDNDRV